MRQAIPYPCRGPRTSRVFSTIRAGVPCLTSNFPSCWFPKHSVSGGLIAGCALLAEAIAQDTGLHDRGRADAGFGDRRYYLDLHAGACRSVEIGAGLASGSLYRLGKDPHCCVDIGFIRPREYGIVSNALYEYFRDNTKGFEELAAFDAGGVFLGVRRTSLQNPAESYCGEFVSGNYLAMFWRERLRGTSAVEIRRP